MCSLAPQCIIPHKGHRPRATKHHHWQHTIGGPLKCPGCRIMREKFKKLLEKKTLITHNNCPDWVDPCNSLQEVIQKTLYEDSRRITFLKLSDIKKEWNVNHSDMDTLMWQIMMNELEVKKALKGNKTWVRKEYSFLTGSMSRHKFENTINQSQYDRFVRKEWKEPERWVWAPSKIFNCSCDYHNEHNTKITRWDAGIYIKLYCIE